MAAREPTEALSVLAVAIESASRASSIFDALYSSTAARPLPFGSESRPSSKLGTEGFAAAFFAPALGAALTVLIEASSCSSQRWRRSSRFSATVPSVPRKSVRSSEHPPRRATEQPPPCEPPLPPPWPPCPPSRPCPSRPWTTPEPQQPRPPPRSPLPSPQPPLPCGPECVSRLILEGRKQPLQACAAAASVRIVLERTFAAAALLFIFGAIIEIAQTTAMRAERPASTRGSPTRRAGVVGSFPTRRWNIAGPRPSRSALLRRRHIIRSAASYARARVGSAAAPL